MRAVYAAIFSLRVGGSLAHARGKMSIRDLRAMLEEHGADVNAVLGVCGSTHDRFSNAAFLSALAVAHRTNPKEAITFLEAIVSGANLSDDSPLLYLRDVLTGAKNPKGSASKGNSTRRDDLNLRTFSAFAAYLQNKSRQHVKPSEAARALFLRPWAIIAA